MLRYHAMGAAIGLDARTVEPTLNELGTYARQLIRDLVALDADRSYVVIRRPGSGPPLQTGPRTAGPAQLISGSIRHGSTWLFSRRLLTLAAMHRTR